MILISHRGNIEGRNPERENSPDYIIEAIDQDFNVEIDLWGSGGSLYLGHEPRPNCAYQISEEWLINKPLLIHCKNLDALNSCRKNRRLNFFFHNEDDFAVSTVGWVISHSKIGHVKDAICMLPEIHGIAKHSLNICAGVCSDIISFYK